MKLLFENWRRFISEEVEEVNIQGVQQLIDANPYLKGKLTASTDNMIKGGDYVLVVPKTALEHIKKRHKNADEPGSLFNPELDLGSAIQNTLSKEPNEVSGGRVKWLGVDTGMIVGKMGVKHTSPEDVKAMKDYTMQDGAKETVKIAAGEREPTNELSLITAELGDLDGKKILSLITAFPGGTKIDGKEIPMNRNDFAEAGFYFVVPQV